MKVKAKEGYGVALSFIYYFCVLAAYYVMRPMRDQLAAEVGSVKLSLFFIATLVAMLLLTPLFSWFVSRWPRRVTMPLVYLFFVACQLCFIPFFNNRSLIPTQVLGLVFFVWVSVFNLFVVSVFWSFMSDIWNDWQARRLFPIIALGGTIGAIAGPLITQSLVETIGSAPLLTISAVLLALAIVCILMLGKWAHQFGAHRKEIGSEAAIGGGMLDGLQQIFSNPFIGSMSLIMLMNDAIGTIAYALIADYSGATFLNNSNAQTRFAAHIDLASNALQIILQLTVARWLLIRYGAGVVFAVSSGIVVITCLMMVLIDNPLTPVVGTLPFVALVLIITRSLSHSMIQPARESLYTLVPRRLRYKGKNAVDTVVWRAGDVISLFSVNAFEALGVTVAGFGMIWAALAAGSGWISWRLARQTERGDYSNSR